MTEWCLATFSTPKGPRAGLVVDRRIHDLAHLSERENFSSVLSILDDWDTNESLIEAVASKAGDQTGLPVSEAVLLAPIPAPSAVFCAGANFADHMIAMAKKKGFPPPVDPRTNGGQPFHFLKASRCCVGTGDPVEIPAPAFDYEVEMVAVIGRAGKNISIEQALSHVAGYMVGNDLSEREWGFRRHLPRDDIFFHSWLTHKSFDKSAPVGPWIVPASRIPDWRQLRIQARVNGELRQNALCGEMTFSLEEQIVALSKVVTLQPGDIIMTGTPGGVGAESDRYLKAGDIVEVSIEGIGAVVTPVI